MSNAKFSALMYREWLIVRSKFFIYVFSSFCASSLGILLVLSFKYGNLAKLPEGIYEFALETGLPVSQYMLVFISGFIMVSVSESAVRDELLVWRRFRISTPVKPWKFSLAKTLIMAIFCAFSLIISFTSVFIINIIIGRDINSKTTTIILFILLATALFSIIFQLAVMMFHTLEKAGLAVCGTFLVILTPVILIVKDIPQEKVIKNLYDFIQDLLPFTPLIYFLLFAVSFFAGTTILKRREK